MDIDSNGLCVLHALVKASSMLTKVLFLQNSRKVGFDAAYSTNEQVIEKDPVWTFFKSIYKYKNITKSYTPYISLHIQSIDQIQQTVSLYDHYPLFLLIQIFLYYIPISFLHLCNLQSHHYQNFHLNTSLLQQYLIKCIFLQIMRLP